MKTLRQLFLAIFILATCVNVSPANGATGFSTGRAAYERDEFSAAQKMFERAVESSPSDGALQNLGNAEWQLGNTAQAIVAWERALAINPFSRHVQNNLQFARENAQLESPDLTWCEIAAAWLPANVWAWIACGSFWFAVGMMIVPGVLRWRRTATQQAAVALGLGLFLLSLPANYGVWTRSEIGFASRNETVLKLTPTKEGEPITRLSAGEPGRVLRERGDHLLIRTRRMTGWVERGSFEFIAPN